MRADYNLMPRNCKTALPTSTLQIRDKLAGSLDKSPNLPTP